MSLYFSYFPKTDYDISKSGNTKRATNIFHRFDIKTLLKNRSVVYYDYDVQDGERPDTVAAKFYGDSRYDWVIMIVNDIFDVDYDWPMDSSKFHDYIATKYESIATANQTIHAYQKILREESYNSKGEHLPEITVNIDFTTYSSLIESNRKTVTKYQHEENLNEAKRHIRLLKPQYLETIIEEAENILE